MKAYTVKLFVYAKTADGWKYLPAVSPAQPVALYNGAEVSGRFMVYQRNAQGKRVWTPVTGDATTALQAAKQRSTDRAVRKRADARLAQLEIVLKGKKETLAGDIERYIQNRRDAGRKEAALDARVALTQFLNVCPVTSTKLITSDHLLAFCKHLAAPEFHYTKRTISNKYDRVRFFLNFCKHDVRLSRSERPTYETTTPTTYGKQETDALFAAADPSLRITLTLGLRLGLRMQEIMFAMWTDIDWTGRTFKVQSKPGLGFAVKDKEQRLVSIPAVVLAELQAWREQHPQTVLIVGTRSDKPNKHLLRALKRTAARVGIEDATLQKLRRSYATTLLESNKVSLATVQSLMGHSDLKSTMRYLKPASGAELLAKIDSIEF